MCSADFASCFVTKKANNVPIEPDEIKWYTVPVSIIDEVKLNLHKLFLKMSLVKCGNVVDLTLFVFTKCPN